MQEGPVIEDVAYRTDGKPPREPLLQKGWVWRLVALLTAPVLIALWKTGHFG